MALFFVAKAASEPTIRFQMLHVWNIYLHLIHLGYFWGLYVGKYSSTMVRIWG